MDPLLMGIGPYSFGPSGIGMNNMMMYPLLNNYQNQVACLEGYNDMMSMNGKTRAVSLRASSKTSAKSNLFLQSGAQFAPCAATRL